MDDVPATFDVFFHLSLARMAKTLSGHVSPHASLANVLEEDLNLEVLCISLVLANGVRINIGTSQYRQTTQLGNMLTCFQ
jgi:hypothetical protein